MDSKVLITHALKKLLSIDITWQNGMGFNPEPSAYWRAQKSIKCTMMISWLANVTLLPFTASLKIVGKLIELLGSGKLVTHHLSIASGSLFPSPLFNSKVLFCNRNKIVRTGHTSQSLISLSLISQWLHSLLSQDIETSNTCISLLIQEPPPTEIYFTVQWLA